jgi:competence protein ComEC
MTWGATVVAALPGAVGDCRPIPTYAFVAMVVGGLWCTLWGTRWRTTGRRAHRPRPDAGADPRRPDVLVGRGAEVVAARGADGRLSALAGRGSSFELARWLEARWRQPLARRGWQGPGLPLRCHEGCAVRVKGLLLSVPATASALRDDCTSAAILVLKIDRPAACAPEATIIDAGDIAGMARTRSTSRVGACASRPWPPSGGRRPWSSPTAPRPIRRRGRRPARGRRPP